MGKNIGVIIGGLVLLVAVGAGSFYGGVVYAQGQAANVRSTFFNGRGGNGGGGNGGNGGGGFGGRVFGTIKSVDGNTLTISTPQNVTTVTLNSATVINKAVTGAPADLVPGDSVTVGGQRDSAGNVTAATIQVFPPGQGPRGAGPDAGPTATP